MSSPHEKKKASTFLKDLKDDTIRALIVIVLLIATIFLILMPLKAAGVVGVHFYRLLGRLLGVGYFILPILTVLLSVSLLTVKNARFTILRLVGATIIFLSAMGLIEGASGGNGGVIGQYVRKPLLSLFDLYLSTVILVGLFAASLLVIFEWGVNMDSIRSLLSHMKFRRTIPVRDTKESQNMMREVETLNIASGEMQVKKGVDLKTEQQHQKGELGLKQPRTQQTKRVYSPPPLNLLEGDRGRPGVGDIKANANIIRRTLQNFGINVEMDEVSIGPSVTRYALKPAEGVKLSRIVSLHNDLALALAAHPIRIEAPIPGKSLVGIEIPNSTKITVGLGSLLSSSEFQNSRSPLLVALGKGVAGTSYFANIAKMPHILIAGATGSGKSVTIHSIITSILYRNSPSELRFIMVDPKRVELTLYNGIPHLLTPVITDAKKTILILKWAAREMERRFDILETKAVRDIESYHRNLVEPALERIAANSSASLPEHLPYFIIVIDELADIMSIYPRELEGAVVRLAQMSRAVGIHLILSTQRPSVNVITGLIKANISTRIALQVTSQVDSRTILDTIGAEKLLGAGDMLYLSAELAKPQRIQSAYVSEEEVKKVVKYLTENYDEGRDTELILTTDDSERRVFEHRDPSTDDENDDELYKEAKDTVLKAGKASTSYLQRRLRIGYARAARLMDLLEERGIIGAGDGSKPRPVIGRPTERNNAPAGDL